MIQFIRPIFLVCRTTFGVRRKIIGTYITEGIDKSIGSLSDPGSAHFPKCYSRSSARGSNAHGERDDDGGSGSSSSSSSDDEKDTKKFVKKKVQKKNQKETNFEKEQIIDSNVDTGRTGTSTETNKKPVAMSAKLLEQILSMKITGSKRERKNEDADEANDKSDTGEELILAKPSGKFKQIRKKLKEEQAAERELKESGLNKEIVAAIKEVASSVAGDPATTESELLAKLKDHGMRTNASRAGVEFNLGEMVTGMKIDRSRRTKRDPASMEGERSPFLSDRAVQRDSPWTDVFRSSSHVPATKPTRPLSKVNLFGATPLNIFSDNVESDSRLDLPPRLELWERLERRELDLLVLHPHANGFEEMITWTKQGKLWHFPINNEQGMEEEAKVGFYDHVFMEPLISDGFPKRGPVRHFMELVAVGLGKNPYLSVTRKREHIDWFRQYFKDKEGVLKEVGALD